jgi:2',3'-cyclic-nucleotide 2'-phosphodiesterase
MVNQIQTMNSENTIRVLFIGDIYGKPGRKATRDYLAKNRSKYDLVIANGENLASGHGMVLTKYEEMIDAGVDYFTSGNHITDKSEFIVELDKPEIRVLRPANFIDARGRGYDTIEIKGQKILIVNLQGQVFIEQKVENPFILLKKIANENKDKIILVDFHAEATSEKVALGLYMDGQISALVGTHTHIQTADEHILPSGTAYISDIGMTGPYDSVIGVEKEIIIRRFLTGDKQSLKVALGDVKFCAVEINIDLDSKKATSIKRLQLS